MESDIEKQTNSRSPEAKEKCSHCCKLSQVKSACSSIGQVEGVMFTKYRCLSPGNRTLGKSYSWKYTLPDAL